jgi:hypothetical protein
MPNQQIMRTSFIVLIMISLVLSGAFIGYMIGYNRGNASNYIYTDSVIARYNTPAELIEDPMQMSFALNLHHEISKFQGHYSDTLLNRIIRDYLKKNNLSHGIQLIRSDSASFEIIASPFNFNKRKEAFFLLTQDHIYSLRPKKIKYLNVKTNKYSDFPNPNSN